MITKLQSGKITPKINRSLYLGVECDKKRHWYTSKEKAFLSMLLDFVEPLNDENRNISSIIANLDESKSDMNSISLDQIAVNCNTLNCYQPKVLICKDGFDIKVYRFSVRHSQRESHREITLIDDNKNSKYKR